MRQHTPKQQFREAQTIAAEHNMFVVDKGSAFLLYRKAERPVFIGKRSSASALRTLVCNAAGVPTRKN